MSCTPCSFTKPVPVCVQELNIGRIAGLNTPIYVFINNLTTGKTVRLSEVSDGAGDIAVDTTGIRFSESFTYEIYVVLQSATSIDDREDILNYPTILTCLAVPFQTVEDEDQDLIIYTTITLELA